MRFILSGEEERINQMVEDIVSNAKLEAKQVLNESKKQVKEILQRGKNAAEKEKMTILENESKKIVELEKQQVASINLQARREILQKKEEEIKKVFDQAQVELKNFTKKAEYPKALEGLIIEAGAALDGGNLVILTRKEDKTKVKDLAGLSKSITKICGNKCSLKISKESVNAIGGIVIQTEDESIKIENTFEARLEQKFRMIRSEVAKKLFN